MKESTNQLLFSWFLAPLLALLLGSQEAVASSCPPVNSDEAMAWLEKMSRSGQEVSYEGVVTFQRGDDMQVMQISHSVSGDTASESLTQLTGQGAQVIRVDHPLQCIHPGHNLLRLAEFERDSNGCGITQHYRLSVGDGERVAGRKAVRILIAPLDMYRYGYIMELDKQTGLLLKTQTIGQDNKVLERFQFANLSYGANVNRVADVELVHKAEHPSPVPLVSPPGNDQDHWTVQWVPSGFVATDPGLESGSRKSYTDGLAVFSVFIELLSREIQPGEGVVRRGGTTSYTRGMRLQENPVLITVIGEVPVNTARMVADSVRWVK